MYEGGSQNAARRYRRTTRMDSGKATVQALVVHPTAGAIQEPAKPAGTATEATTIHSATAMGAGTATATVAAAAATTVGTKYATKLEPRAQLAKSVEEMTVRGNEEY